VVEPDKYTFNQEEIEGITLNYLQNNQEIAYYQNNNILFLANSRDKIINFTNNKNLLPYTEINTCLKENSFNFSQNLYISHSLLNQYFAVLAKYINNIVAQDDLAQNGKFWLCLD
jgi:hypothetical protein